MDVLLIIDMQEGLLAGPEKHDLSAVVQRINRLAGRVRDRGGQVIFVQHDGAPGDAFEPLASGRAILSAMERDPRDRCVRKTLNDGFLGADEVIAHHHWIWANIISAHPVEIVAEAEIH